MQKVFSLLLLFWDGYDKVYAVIKMTERTDMAAKILKTMNERGISYGELSAMTGIPKSALQRYATGATEKIPLSRVERIAKALGLSAGWLLGWEDAPCQAPRETAEAPCPVVPLYHALNARGQEEYIRYGRYLAAQEEYRSGDAAPPVEYIRHYLTAAAAGYAAPIEGEDYELLPRDASTPHQADFCIDIAGDSMEPYIMDGQRVYVQRGADLREFEVGVFFLDGDVYCKQWCEGYNGELYLLSANPARQDANITIRRDSGRSCVCFGKVLLNGRLPRPQYLG